MIYFGLSDVGIVRKHNEDTLYIKSFDDEHILSLVADGMGGHKGGKMASLLAVQVISQYIESLMPAFISYSERKIKQSFLKAIQQANNEIYQSSLKSDELNGMGTTVVVCYISNCKVYIFNAGDSRLYIVNDSIKQITKDHSFVGELLEFGMISENEAKTHPKKNIITRALGTEANVDIDMYEEKILPGDTVLMCTDGLTNMINDERILNIVNSDLDVEIISKKLVDEAKNIGGLDNITVVLLKNNIGGCKND